MPDIAQLALFTLAAAALAITPGPGIAYVAARTLAGGRAEGVASSFGTALGGLVHVVAGAVGVSALVMASAEAFTIFKIVGAIYLIVIGIRTIRDAGAVEAGAVQATGSLRAFRDGVVIEALNPKTAAFFLAFIPQFIVPDGSVAAQFVLLGLICVVLNTGVDIVVAFVAGGARQAFTERPHIIRRIRQGSGGLMCALGALLLLARRPAT